MEAIIKNAYLFDIMLFIGVCWSRNRSCGIRSIQLQESSVDALDSPRCLCWAISHNSVALSQIFLHQEEGILLRNNSEDQTFGRKPLDPEERLKSFTFRLSFNLIEQLERYAKFRRITRSELIRQIIEEWIERHGI